MGKRKVILCVLLLLIACTCTGCKAWDNAKLAISDGMNQLSTNMDFSQGLSMIKLANNSGSAASMSIADSLSESLAKQQEIASEDYSTHGVFDKIGNGVAKLWGGDKKSKHDKRLAEINTQVAKEKAELKLSLAKDSSLGDSDSDSDWTSLILPIGIILVVVIILILIIKNKGKKKVKPVPKQKEQPAVATVVEAPALPNKDQTSAYVSDKRSAVNKEKALEQACARAGVSSDDILKQANGDVDAALKIALHL